MVELAADTRIQVSVQACDFDVASLQAALLSGQSEEGAVATFTGYVRRANEQREVDTLVLEHYPGMTEASIREIIRQAGSRWPVLAASVVHRVGTLRAGEQIVWVGVSAAHREAAFSACEFIMDFLKTRAPFWKQEHGPGGAHWVAARSADDSRAARWHAESTQ
jgi:molybdopterin synthase catalytic subunit